MLPRGVGGLKYHDVEWEDISRIVFRRTNFGGNCSQLCTQTRKLYRARSGQKFSAYRRPSPGGFTGLLALGVGHEILVAGSMGRSFHVAAAVQSFIQS